MARPLCEKNRSNLRITLVCVSFFALLGMLLPVVGSITPANAQTGISSSFQLQIVPTATKLPADGGTYYGFIQLQTVRDSKPTVAPYDFDVRISSSDPSVVSTPEFITIREGESIVKVTLMTTSKSGEASITVQAEGVRSASVTVNTLNLDSLEPTKIAVTSAPTVLVPDPTIAGVIYIQLLNSQNLPAATEKELLVSLSSSNPQFGTVLTSVRLPPGSTGISVPFTPTDAIGKTTISASAPGLAPAQVDVSTDGPVPTNLVVEFGPPRIPSFKGFKSVMTVQLRDSLDNPVKATDPVLVTLRSSDTSITSVPDTMTILPGESYSSTMLTSQGSTGKVEITASALGIGSGIGDLETTDLSEGISTYHIELYQVPSKLPPDNSTHRPIIIQFLDSSNRPYNALGPLYDKLILSSSDPKIATILPALEKQYGFAIGSLKTTYLVGTTTITASSTGLTSSQEQFTVSGATPSALKLTKIPTVIQANAAQSHSLLVASLVDPSGKPTAARVDTVVYLSSSNPAVASPEPSVIISAGKNYEFINVDTSDTPGEATISATSTGLSTGNLNTKIVGSIGTTSELGLALTTIPQIIANGQEYEAIFVQLQDVTGKNPVPAESDIPISLSSSSSAGGRVTSDVTITKGSSFAIAKFLTSDKAEEVRVTASSPGFKSVDVSFKTSLQAASVTFANPPLNQAEFDTQIPVEVQANTGPFPIKGATIEISGLYADPTYTITDETGFAKGVYIPNRPGTNTIEARLIMPGYQESLAKSGISLSQSVDIVVKAASEGGRDIPASFKVQPQRTTAKTYTTQAVFTDAKFGSYTVTALDTKNSLGEFKFVSWSDGDTQNPRVFDVIRDDTITAVYSANFALQISSEYGSTWGTGYYPEGATPMIGVDSTYVSAGLIDKDFAGWSGDILSDSPTTQVTMTSPKVIKAEWQNNYLKIITIVGGTGSAGLLLYKKMIKPRKVKKELARGPDLDWYKT